MSGHDDYLQVYPLTVKADRVKRGEQPTFEFHLPEGHRVISAETWNNRYDNPDRKTVDWELRMLVEVRFPAALAASKEENDGA